MSGLFDLDAAVYYACFTLSPSILARLAAATVSMNDPWMVMVGAAVSVYTVIAVGGAIRLAGWTTREADQSLMQLIIRLLMPCLIFSVITNNEALKAPENLIFPPLVGFTHVVLGFGVALLLTRLSPRVHGMVDRRQFGTFALTIGVFNYGYIPLPLVKVLYGESGLGDETLGVLFVYNIGVELALWTFGVMLLSGQLGQWWRQMLNPVSLTIVAALAFNFTDGTRYLPEFILRGIGWLGESAIPMSLILVGAIIADQLRHNESPPRRSDSLKTMFWSCFLRLALLPVLFLLVVYLLPVSDELRRVVVIQAAMPSAIFPIVLARHYAGSPGTAMLVALSTSAVSLVTIPLWISAGLKFLGIE